MICDRNNIPLSKLAEIARAKAEAHRLIDENDSVLLVSINEKEHRSTLCLSLHSSLVDNFQLVRATVDAAFNGSENLFSEISNSYRDHTGPFDPTHDPQTQIGYCLDVILKMKSIEHDVSKKSLMTAVTYVAGMGTMLETVLDIANKHRSNIEDVDRLRKGITGLLQIYKLKLDMTGKLLDMFKAKMEDDDEDKD